MELPSGPGAYALYLRLDAEFPLPVLRLNRTVLEPGTYVYAGSAYGPGGIRARVARHLRREKIPHWHIDHLTVRAECVDVLTYPGGSECALVAALLADGAEIPVPGFGSSDCRNCAAHFLRLAVDFQTGNIAAPTMSGTE